MIAYVENSAWLETWARDTGVPIITTGGFARVLACDELTV